MSRILVMKGEKQVASAQNLEVLGRYHRQGGVGKKGIWHSKYAHPVSKSTATRLPNGAGLLQVWYTDGAKAEAKFVDYNVLTDWLAAKRKLAGWA